MSAISTNAAPILEDAVSAAYEKARTLGVRLNAFAHLPAKVPQAARNGPLAGTAVGIKDIIDTADMPTGYGSAIDPAHLPSKDAWIVSRIRALGGTVIGKTVTTEFAWRHPGATVNPRDEAHTPGGSSSGSAAAVGAGIVPLALGTQTVGSVIRPAAYCGVVGFKPSYGSIPRTGVHPLSWSLDHVGLFARSVDDVSTALLLFAMRDESDLHGGIEAATADSLKPTPSPRIAVIDPPAWDRVDDAQRMVRDRFAKACAAAGAKVEAVDLDPLYNHALDDIMTILRVEARQIYRERVERYPDRTSAHLKALVADGAGISADDYLQALTRQSALRAKMQEDFAGFDAVLTVPATGEAPKGLSDTGDPSLCAPWTFIGCPAITLPVGQGENGLPLGIQLVAPFRRDIDLLRTARFGEEVIAGT